MAGDGLLANPRAILPRSFRLRAGMPSAGQIPLEGDQQAVRRYELMLVLRPDAPDERAAAVIDRTTRYVVDEAQLMALTDALRGVLLDPLKTTVVQHQRCMTTWVLAK